MGHRARKETIDSNPTAPDIQELVMVAARAATEKKADELVLLDLREVASFTEFFLICTGANTRQVQAISNEIEERLRDRGKKPLHIEGYSSGEWILLDYGDFIVHVFSVASRRFYDLERLWRDARRIDVKDYDSARSQ
jgi:ribosome-associated protein